MFAAVARSETRRENRRVVYGPEFPEEVDANSYVTMTELRRMAKELRVGPGQTFVDLGCGRGGPGMWVARETGASVLGIDQIAVALAQATERVAEFGLTGRARFQAGDMQATGLPDATLDGAISIDALVFAEDKRAAFRETARILRRGSRFIFTGWESDRPTLAGNATVQYADFRPLLEEAGFTTDVYEEPPGWREQMREVYRRDLATGERLIAEMGEVAARRMIDQAEQGLENLDVRRRVFAVARNV
jgi:ubiquinone/menaquinone biosynthesis C-methylase UbiE